MLKRVITLAAIVAAIPLAVSAQTQNPIPPLSDQTIAPLAANDRILVMPFDIDGDEARIYWLREGASVLLSDDLRMAGANVIGREDRVRAFERLGVPLHASLSEATVIKIGELLGAASVVTGAVSLDGEQLQVHAHSIRLDTGRLAADVTEKAPTRELFHTFDRMLARLFPLITAPANHTEKDHAPLTAFENYIKGLVSENAATQVKFLQAAITAYPAYDAARLALWQIYTAQSAPSKALPIAMDVPEKSAFYRRARFLAALSEMQLGRLQQAYDVLHALDGQKAAATVSNNLGVVQLRRNNLPEQAGSAKFHFNRAHDLDPADKDYTFNLGYAAVLERDMQAAVYWLREAVRRDTADGEAHYLLGLALVGSGSTVEGNREKELARRLSSKFADWEKRPADSVPKGLERLKDDLEPSPGARGELAFQASGQKDQRDLARFHMDLGRKLFEEENDRDATAELKRAVYLSPYEAEAHMLLGRISLRNGRTREAIDELKIALWSRETPEGHVALAEAYLQMKDLNAARSEAQRALALDPKSAAAKNLLDRIGGFQR